MTSFRDATREFQVGYFAKLMREHPGRVDIIADLADMSKSYCYRKLRDLGLITKATPRARRKDANVC